MRKCQKSLLACFIVFSLIGGCENSNNSQLKKQSQEVEASKSPIIDGEIIGLICKYVVTEKISINGEQDGEATTESKEEKYIIDATKKTISSVDKIGNTESYAGKAKYKVGFKPDFINVNYKEEKDFDGVMDTTFSDSFTISRKTLEYSSYGYHLSSSGGSAPFLRNVEFEGKGKCDIVNPNTFKKVQNKF